MASGSAFGEVPAFTCKAYVDLPPLVVFQGSAIYMGPFNRKTNTGHKFGSLEGIAYVDMAPFT